MHQSIDFNDYQALTIMTQTLQRRYSSAIMAVVFGAIYHYNSIKTIAVIGPRNSWYIHQNILLQYTHPRYSITQTSTQLTTFTHLENRFLRALEERV
jgi:hypothetical protein